MIRLEIVLDEVTKKFGGNLVLDKVSIRLEGKGCFGYLGPNGAGKTTSMKVLTSLLRPDKGSASINGVDVAKNPVGAMKFVGALVEDPEPYSFMTGQEFITFAAKIRGIERPPMEELKAKLDLPPLEKRCNRLSKGQKRRIFLAAVIAQDPEVLILDEPTAGLDPAESVLFRNLIADLKKEKLVLFSSHLLYEVTQLCEEVTFINKGRIVQSGSVEEVSRRFASKTLRVEFAVQIAEAAVKEMQSNGVVSGYKKESERAYLLDFGSEETRKQIVDACYGIGLRSIQDMTLGLEQAFMELMGERD